MTAGPGEALRPPSATVVGATADAPSLTFTVTDGLAEPYAAVPTLRLDLDVENRSAVAIRSLVLAAQVRIAVNRRAYTDSEQVRLTDLFGTPERWGETLRSLYWTQATVVVPPFDRKTSVGLFIPCTYDFDVAAAKYMHGAQNGHIPLELLFSGSIFYEGSDGRLRTARLSWAAEAAYNLPLRVWKDMMNHYFPDSAWLRLQRDAFDKLYAYKAANSLPSWETALDRLLDATKLTERHT